VSAPARLDLKDLETLFWVRLSLPSSHLTFRPLLIRLPSLSSSLHNRLRPGLLTLPSRGTTVRLLPLLLFMSSVNNQEHQDLATQELKLRCQILQIDNRAANFRCDEYRKLLLPQHPGEPLTQPEPVAPVGPVVLTDAAVAPRQRLDGPSGARGGQARAVRACARVSCGGGRGLQRTRQSQISYVCLVA
jgi:hypothetical protein